jgi:hypothetical protein
MDNVLGHLNQLESDVEQILTSTLFAVSHLMLVASPWSDSEYFEVNLFYIDTA